MASAGMEAARTEALGTVMRSSASYRKFMLLFQLDPHDGFPPEQFDQLTPRQKELLRMKKGLGVPHAADVHFR